MEIKVMPAEQNDRAVVLNGMQAAFQDQYEKLYWKTDEPVLPLIDLEEILSSPDAILYKAVEGAEIVGGAIVEVDAITQHNFLHCMYVSTNRQDQGIGTEIWLQIEKLHSETKIWEVSVWKNDSPRNMPFYIGKCGFSVADYLKDIPEEELNCVILQKIME